MHLLHILLISIASLGFSNDETKAPDPISWTFTVEKVAEGTFEMVAVADIKKGWYLYSQDNGDDGPVPTSFEFSPSDQVTLTPDVSEEGDLIKKHDELFDMVISKYTTKVTFRQRYKSSDSTGTIKGYVTYMTCDGLRCLPPKDVDFNVSL